MKNSRGFPKFIFLLAILLFCTTAQICFSQTLNDSPLPAPTEPVNDFANVIDDSVEQRINQKIKDFKTRTNPPVVFAVAVVDTTGEQDIFTYSLSVARGWKIGTKEDDNPSALLFIAVNDRKYMTQISKDLQDELPDGLAGQLQRQYLVPALKQGDYSKGVADTIDAYIRTVEAKQSGLATPTPEPIGKTTQQGKKSSFSLCGIAPCLIILFIIMIAIFSRAGRGKNKNDRNRWGGGGGFGGGGGGVLPWIIGSAIANSIGNSSSGGGSSSDWGGSGSSSGDWGGFGGGGDFDGGGSGGDW